MGTRVKTAMTGETPVPTTWSALLDRYGASPGADRRGFDYFHSRLEGKSAESLLFAVPFQSCAEVVATTLVLGDAGVAAGQIAALAPWLGQVAQGGAGVLPRAGMTALGLIAMAEMTRATGLPVDAGAAPRLLPGLFDLEAAEDRRAAIWAHLAFGAVEGLGDLLPGDLAAPSEDGAFGPNVQGAQVEIARAIAHRAAPESVAAAWDSYRAHVPRLIAAGQGSMLELILAARAVGCVLGGQAGPRVLDGLRAAVR